MRILGLIVCIVVLALATDGLRAADSGENSTPVWVHVKEADTERAVRLDYIALLRRDPLADRSGTIYAIPSGATKAIAVGKVEDDEFDRLYRFASRFWIGMSGEGAREVYANPQTITDVSFTTGVTASGQQASISANGVLLGLVTSQTELAKLKALITPK